MPKGHKESRFAAKLRELGFRPYNEILSPADMEETDREFEKAVGYLPSKLSRTIRRQLEAQKVLPGFCMVRDPRGAYTYAMDELGNDWQAEGIVDLAPFGFNTKIKKFEDIAAARVRKNKLH